MSHDKNVTLMFSDFFSILLFLALIAVGITLILGIASMFRSRPSKNQAEDSNYLMRLRIILQAVALIILAILLFVKK